MTTIATLSATDATPHLETTEAIFRKLLVAVDFSAQARQTLKIAAAVAACFDAEVILIHAATPVIDGAGACSIPVDSYAVNLEAERGKLTELIAGEPAMQSIKHREIVRYGMPVELVQQAVETHKVDLVIACSHSARGLERLALGSVVEAIVRHVNCPVLIVGPRATGFACPFRSVLFASKLNVAELRAAQYASALAEKFHGKLALVHVIEDKEGPPGPEPELIQHVVQNELMSLLPSDIDSYSKADMHVAYGKPADAITLIAQEACASLIVCGVRENAALADHTPGSTLAQVIRRSHCPVLCVRAHSA